MKICILINYHIHVIEKVVRHKSCIKFKINSNLIDFPAGILQDVFYNKDRPQYLNYSGIGAFGLRYEITRTFDDEGRKYDKNGILNDWWTPETRIRFIQNSDCIIEQYRNYTIEEVGLKLCIFGILKKKVLIPLVWTETLGTQY